MPENDPAEAIAAALARLRGRRAPRPGEAYDGKARGDGAGPGPGLFAGRGQGPHGPHWSHGGPHAMGHGAPPWAAGGHGRFAGLARLRLLEALAAASGSLSVGEIAAAIGVDQPRASRLVQQAVHMGLVRREADPDDARRTRIALTDEGMSIQRRVRGDRREAIATALADFSDAERAELARLLTKLADAWPH